MSRSRTAAAIVALALPLALAACGGQQVGLTMSEDPIRDHHTAVSRQPRALVLPSDGRGNVAATASRMRSIVVDHARRGHGPMVLRGAAPDVATAARMLVRAGASADAVRPVPMRAADAPGGGVALTFEAFAATPPECGRFESDGEFLAGRHTNMASSDWGCSNSRNLGLMLSDPLDLVHARGSNEPTDGSRAADRVVDYGKYERPLAPSTNNLQR